MEPVRQADHTKTYVGEREEGGKIVLEGVGDLSGRIEEDGSFTSHWRPSDAELSALNGGAVVELNISAMPIPPVGLGVRRDLEPPPEEEADEEPPEDFEEQPDLKGSPGQNGRQMPPRIG